MSDTVIKVESLHKKFCKSLKRSMLYGTIDAAKSMFGFPIENVDLRKKEFWALQDINFELKRGETLGLIGQNGCGKTTMLRLLNGIFPPDKGKITINGRIGALIAVGAGFHPHMTGRENIYLNGTILGMTKNELKRKFDEIVDFAEIGDFIDAPVATYSSGMTVRLGFAIAINCEPDILLIDEILAVGDLGFQTKCYNMIGALKKSGVASILVSHDLHSINAYCNKAILINNGSQIIHDEVSIVVAHYIKYFNSVFESDGEIEKPVTGTDNFKISKVEFNPGLNNSTIWLKSGSDLSFSISYYSKYEINDAEINMVLDLPISSSKRFFQGSNKTFNKVVNFNKGHGKITVTIKDINLNNFIVYLYIDIWEKNRANRLFYWRKIPINVEGELHSLGWNMFNVEYKNERNE
jgi:lipopolysaccharide transport system ATP-binding protein